MTTKTKKFTESGPIATLTLTIELTGSLRSALEAAKEIVENAQGYASVEGYVDIHRAERIFIGDLK